MAGVGAAVGISSVGAMQHSAVEVFQARASSGRPAIVVFYRGERSRFCRAWLRRWLSVPALERRLALADVALLFVSSQSQGKAYSVAEQSGVPDHLIDRSIFFLGDPQHGLAAHLEASQLLSPVVTNPAGHRAHAWVYDYGMIQPAVVAVAPDLSVLFAWAMRPSFRNAGGKLERPDPWDVWDYVERKLDRFRMAGLNKRVSLDAGSTASVPGTSDMRSQQSFVSAQNSTMAATLPRRSSAYDISPHTTSAAIAAGDAAAAAAAAMDTSTPPPPDDDLLGSLPVGNFGTVVGADTEAIRKAISAPALTTTNDDHEMEDETGDPPMHDPLAIDDTRFPSTNVNIDGSSHTLDNAQTQTAITAAAPVSGTEEGKTRVKFVFDNEVIHPDRATETSEGTAPARNSLRSEDGSEPYSPDISALQNAYAGASAMKVSSESSNMSAAPTPMPTPAKVNMEATHKDEKVDVSSGAAGSAEDAASGDASHDDKDPQNADDTDAQSESDIKEDVPAPDSSSEDATTVHPDPGLSSLHVSVEEAQALDPSSVAFLTESNEGSGDVFLRDFGAIPPTTVTATPFAQMNAEACEQIACSLQAVEAAAALQAAAALKSASPIDSNSADEASAEESSVNEASAKDETGERPTSAVAVQRPTATSQGENKRRSRMVDEYEIFDEYIVDESEQECVVFESFHDGEPTTVDGESLAPNSMTVSNAPESVSDSKPQPVIMTKEVQSPAPLPMPPALKTSPAVADSADEVARRAVGTDGKRADTSKGNVSANEEAKKETPNIKVIQTNTVKNLIEKWAGLDNDKFGSVRPTESKTAVRTGVRVADLVSKTASSHGDAASSTETKVTSYEKVDKSPSKPKPAPSFHKDETGRQKKKVGFAVAPGEGVEDSLGATELKSATNTRVDSTANQRSSRNFEPKLHGDRPQGGWFVQNIFARLSKQVGSASNDDSNNIVASMAGISPAVANANVQEAEARSSLTSDGADPSSDSAAKAFLKARQLAESAAAKSSKSSQQQQPQQLEEIPLENAQQAPSSPKSVTSKSASLPRDTRTGGSSTRINADENEAKLGRKLSLFSGSLRRAMGSHHDSTHGSTGFSNNGSSKGRRYGFVRGPSRTVTTSNSEVRLDGREHPDRPTAGLRRVVRRGREEDATANCLGRSTSLNGNEKKEDSKEEEDGTVKRKLSLAKIGDAVMSKLSVSYHESQRNEDKENRRASLRFSREHTASSSQDIDNGDVRRAFTSDGRAKQQDAHLQQQQLHQHSFRNRLWSWARNRQERAT